MKSKISFREINKLAALQATKALSKLLDVQVHVDIPAAKLEALEQVPFIIKPTDKTAGVQLSIIGDAEGTSLLVFPEETVFCLCDLLLKKKPGTTKKLTELDKSALKEIGNIVIGNYLTIFSNKLHIRLIESIPEFKFDKFSSIIDEVVVKVDRAKMQVLIITIDFTFIPSTLRGHALIFFYMEEIKRMFGEL